MTIERHQLHEALHATGRVPLAGAGDTAARFAALADLAARDLALARLAEGHLDALAICAEAGHAPPVGLSGVWAADPPSGRLRAGRQPDGWVLDGIKRWCSGAGMLDSAIVTAHGDDGYRLFVVDLRAAGITPRRGSWRAVGMADSDTLDVEFDDVLVGSADAVGGPEWYLRRRGFWIGGIGVAACWYGGALGAMRALRDAMAKRDDDPHGLAHLGACDALCAAMRSQLQVAAQRIDDGIEGHDLRHLAWRVRAAVERLATDVLEHAARGVGAGGLTADAAMARRAADLPVYLRQHHAERDLAELGRLVLQRP